ncbi:hypothetical protein [Pseudoduganella sp. R-43]|uniref:hypothetical protein n=1 Tax=Pseudoduganella sp. R-43 TaxID=3404063 RepID=UPI003CEEFB95
MQVIEVDGIAYEAIEVANQAPRNTGRVVPAARVPGDEQFKARLENWRHAVRGADKRGGGAQCCAAWARQYVLQRAAAAGLSLTSVDGGDRLQRPLACTGAELDGWVVEAAWRLLSDANERQVLKALYIHQWPADQVRRFVRGVRGPHVPLLIAKAERNLRSILITLGSPATIQATTCLPGCPEPSAESASPWRRRLFV